MNKHIKYFQNYLFSKNLSNKTIEIYGNNIVYLEKYLLSINKDLLTATNDDITNYFKTQTLKTTSYNNKITCIQMFYKYLSFEKINYELKVNKIEHIKNDKVYPRIISYDDIKNMISSCGDSLLGIRNKAIITFLYVTGLRVSELVNLTFNDINLNEGYIRCIGKGNK